MTDTQDQLIVLPGTDSNDAGANNAAQERAKRRSGSLSTMLLPELQALASSMGITTGKMRKSDLVAAIESAKHPQVSAPATRQRAVAAADTPVTQAPMTTTTRTRRSASRPVTSTQPALTEQAGDSQPAGAAPATDNGSQDATARGERSENGSTRQAERSRTREPANQNDQSANREGQATTTRDGHREQNNRDGNRDQNNRDQNNRDQNNRDQNNRDQNNRDQNNRDQNNRDQNNRDQNNRDRNQGNRNQNGPGNDDDDEFGGSRRGRRYRDRRGRTRDRADSPSGVSRNDVEPTISEDDVLVPVAGILDNVDDKGSWFIRVSGYFASSDDVYVANSHIRRYNLRRGDAVTGAVRQAREGERKEKFNPLVRLDTVNGVDPEQIKNRVEFTKLTPLYPQERLRLETEPHILTTRVIDLVMPIGKGQRALIVSPPKAGKTMIMQAIANAIATNNPECHLMVVLIDERPEEVTDMQRSVKGEVIASTFDRRPQDHTMVAELSIERAKRLVEMGHDVVVLLDSITRLGRAYNLGAPASGRILSGGVDSTALYPPKRFLGAARNIEDGGSLTIIASALVETGSAGDTVIFEEFKGTGNAELKLDRKIADKRVFPAVDVDQSSTRKEEILLSPDELAVVIKLRRVLHALDPQQGIDLLLDRLRKTRTNIEFLMQIAKTTPGADDR